MVEEDLVLIENYYSQLITKEEDFRRRDLFTLLGNWGGEVDRARAPQLFKQKPKSIGQQNLELAIARINRL
jgi:hypothetical protein